MELLHTEIAKRKKQIHPEHSARFNHDMQLQIYGIEWVLEKIEVNKVLNDRLDGLVRKMIKDLEKIKDKAMIRPDTDDLRTKIETLKWVLIAIRFATKYMPEPLLQHNKDKNINSDDNSKSFIADNEKLGNGC